MSTPPQLSHWRTNGGAEVDLLLERDGSSYRRDTTGISAFRKIYPHLRVEHGLVIAPIPQVLQLSEDDWAIPGTWTVDT